MPLLGPSPLAIKSNHSSDLYNYRLILPIFGHHLMESWMYGIILYLEILKKKILVRGCLGGSEVEHLPLAQGVIPQS